MQQLKLLATMSSLLSGVLAAGGDAGPRPRNVKTSWLPKETVDLVAADVRGGPRPTSPPKAVFGQMELVKRYPGYTMGPDTCGFVASFWGAYIHARATTWSLQCVPY